MAHKELVAETISNSRISGAEYHEADVCSLFRCFHLGNDLHIAAPVHSL